MEARAADPRTARPHRLIFRCAVLACLTVALLSRLCFLAQPFKNDAGIYIELGKILWQGGMPYVHFWDTKLPSVPLLMAPLWALFGNHWVDYVLLQALLGIAGPAVLARAVGRHVSTRGFAPALLCGLVALNVSRLTLTGFQLETVQAFFELCAAAALLRCLDGGGAGACFGTGLLIGLAALPKPTGLAIGGAAGLTLLLQTRLPGNARVRRVAALAAGTLLPLLAVAIWVAAQPWRSEMGPLLREIRLYGSGTPWRSLLLPKTGIFFLLPLLPLALRWIFSTFLPRERIPATPGAEPSASASRDVARFAVLWLLLEFLAVLVQRRLYGYHFLVLMSPATLCFALLPVPPRLWVTLTSIAPLAILSLWFALPAYPTMNADRRPSPVSEYIAAHSEPTDTIWGDPSGRLLLEADRPPGARLQMSFYLVNHDGAPQQFTDSLINDFTARRPRFIVLSANWWTEVAQVEHDTPGLIYDPPRRADYDQQCHRLFDFVTTHYHPVATLDGRTIYQRNVTSPAGQPHSHSQGQEPRTEGTPAVSGKVLSR